MLAANIWHWWIGVVLAVVSLVAVLGLVGGYLAKVTAMQHPNRRQREAMRAELAAQSGEADQADADQGASG